MCPRRLNFVLALGVCCLAGCFSPRTTRLPGPHFQSQPIERYRAEVVDPYPDSSSGPDTGFRPLGFQQQRSESLRSKRRANEVLSAPIFAPQGGFPQSGYNPAYQAAPAGYMQPAAMYPNAVPYN